MKRIVIIAVLAVIVLVAAASGIWFTTANGVRADVAAQTKLAASLLDAKTPSETIALTLVRPGLHVVIFDGDRGVIDAASGGMMHRPLPPGEASPREGLRPPGAGPPRPPQAPLETFALRFVALQPVRVERGDITVEISPDGRDLAQRFATLIVRLAAAILVVLAVAVGLAARSARIERETLEARVVERRAETERYQRFLAETGHELRTPLTVMTGYVDILRSRPTPDSIDARILEGMHEETVRMRVLVEKMLTLARLESQAAVPRLLDVADAARDAVKTAARRYPDREFRVHAGAAASIVIDADDYAAALGNLLENAIKYAPASPIDIETSIAGRLARTDVIDLGPGIDPAERKAIFDRFYRGRGSAYGEGIGLGLAIVKRITDRWNGTVECESVPGRTVFRMSFPLADEETYAVTR